MKCDILLVKVRENEMVEDIIIAPPYSYIKVGDIVTSTNTGGTAYKVVDLIQGYSDEYSTSEDIRKIIEWSTRMKLEKIQKVKEHFRQKEIVWEEEEDE